MKVQKEVRDYAVFLIDERWRAERRGGGNRHLHPPLTTL